MHEYRYKIKRLIEVLGVSEAVSMVCSVLG